MRKTKSQNRRAVHVTAKLISAYVSATEIIQVCRVPKTVLFCNAAHIQYNDKQHFKRAYQLYPVCGDGKAWLGKGNTSIEMQSCRMFFISNYMSIMLFWFLYEWNINVSTPHPEIKISLTHITRSDKGSLSPRTFKHSEFIIHKTMYLAPGCKFPPGCKLCT